MNKNMKIQCESCKQIIKFKTFYNYSIKCFKNK